MAVVEYKHHVYLGDHRRHIPGFISDPEQLHNPANHTFVGWAKENADYYIPWTTLKVLSKEDIVQRLFLLHSQTPIRVMDPNSESPMQFRELTSEEEVRAHAESWYDNFVARNSA
jgi:hypothetical protein